MDTTRLDPMGSGLPVEADIMLREAPPPPFDWVREGTSYWVFEENGEFGLPRIGVEAEPYTWDNRLFQHNFAFADGRLLQDVGRGAATAILDGNGYPMIMGAGPLKFQCLEPFHRWRVTFDGTVIDTHVRHQIAGTVDTDRRIPLKYTFEATMAVPANVMDHSPKKFSTWGKGKQRDAVSVGLGWRFEQMLRCEGEMTVDRATRGFRLVGSRIKRRSVRTDSLMLRGHCWQAVLFPDGSAAGYEARPVHDDGLEPYNEGFVYKDGKLYHAKATKMPWFRKIVERGADISVELESELGTTRIEGVSELSTFMLRSDKMWGLDLQQSGGRYSWNGQTAYGMIERSATPGQIPRG